MKTSGLALALLSSAAFAAPASAQSIAERARIAIGEDPSEVVAGVQERLAALVPRALAAISSTAA